MSLRTVALGRTGRWSQAQGQAGNFLPVSSVQSRRILSQYSTSSNGFYTSNLPTTDHDENKSAKDGIDKRTRDKFAEREFLFSVLSSTSTKREARSYLSRFKPWPGQRTRLFEQQPDSSTAATTDKLQNFNSSSTGINGTGLGGLYPPTRAVGESPVFTQHADNSSLKPLLNVVEPLHVALVQLRQPQLLDEAELEGIGLTLTQLARLGMVSAVVLDCEMKGGTSTAIKDSGLERKLVVEQAERVLAGIEANQWSKARRVDGVIGIPSKKEQTQRSNALYTQARVTSRESLLTPMRRGIIPVITPIAYTMDTQTATLISSDELFMALTKEFVGITTPSWSPSGAYHADLIRTLQRQTSLDRLIILDPLGGIPSSERPQGSHVFINMEQEFDDIKAELKRYMAAKGPARHLASSENLSTTVGCEDLASSKRSPAAGDNTEHDGPKDAGSTGSRVEKVPALQMHLRNLEVLRKCLALLPPTSSALITTPQDAANSGRILDSPLEATGVGTRRTRNTLIHNLLTDKPAFSSSLPNRRLGLPPANNPFLQESPSPTTRATTTFVKRGMPLTILPDPRVAPWRPPHPGKPNLTLDDPRIDLSRLINLIEDSFGRPIDVRDYLSRVNDRIAGIIIAGEYEGGALLTWETPPGIEIDENNPEASRMRMVPYLDKFAVLRRSQGAGGVADIVFKAMVRSCLPDGVCWRSRRDNPVNKWYFERSRGTWKLPDSNWTMFWTTEDLPASSQTFLDYEAVCRTIMPSWADNKAVMD
ncbi:N-acetylglutamate synthase [Xylona heveae TC161]|uniref:Amino-acid acetyltransferase, mitochondrial n=1 Tax=Xylona heveae (strain CBS 132557 / TC161) TaxID=1328760 RepID=A0A165JVZ8_XYLHT|nr:N-acetylglutamate synthase [Xylona heveae TC161]KZF26694.1 N-acetylglutamate synthase [Xylona heveae TC161]